MKSRVPSLITFIGASQIVNSLPVSLSFYQLISKIKSVMEYKNKLFSYMLNRLFKEMLQIKNESNVSTRMNKEHRQ